MKGTFLAAGMACLAAPALAATAFNAPADVAAIKAVEQKNAEHLDVTELRKSFAPDAVILDFMSGGVDQGRPAIEKAVAGVLGSWSK